MSGYYDRIQGTDRLLRIRRIRKAVFAGLLALTVLLIAARMESEGASIKPLFFPINGVLEVALIMGLIAAIVGLLLKNLEIHNIQRDSQRHLLAKSSMTRAVRTAGFAIGIAVLLLLAVTPSVAASLFSDPPQVIALADFQREVVSFSSPDPLGVSFVTHAIVNVSQGSASVSLLRNSVAVGSPVSISAPDQVTFNVEETMWSAYANWSLVFRNTANGSTTYVRFILEKGVIPTLFSTIPFLLFLYAAAQVGWWVALRPIRERTKGSLYTAGAEIADGERVYDGSSSVADPTSDPAAETMAFNFAAAPPAPPAPTPPPPPPYAPSVRAVPTMQAAVPRAEPPKPVPRPPVPVRPPDTAQSLTMKAEALAAARTYEPAVTAYEEALRMQPGYLPALQGLASCYVALNRRPEALETRKRILAKDPRNLDALRAIARMHVEDRRWRECLEAVGDILRIRPNEASALEMKGDALTNLGRRPEALAAYEGAEALDPSNENLRQKIEEVRVDVPGLLSRALIASASGNYPQALSLFDDILEVEPSNVNALIGKAVAYRRSGKPQEAVNCLDLVLGVQPNNASALLNRGNILIEAEDYDGALDAFDRLTQLYPGDEEAWSAQGDVLVKMGRDDDALRAYTEALKLSPGDEGIQRRILELEAAKTVDSEILLDLTKIKGIGQARAKALIDAGFASAEDFAKANLKDLMAVRGVTRKIAEELVQHFRALLAAAR
jgi:tetratricopeptide (TPR) repeat protein